MLEPYEETRPIQMKLLPFSYAAIAIMLSLSSRPALAWGPAGHANIGNMAMAELEPAARAQVMDILQLRSADALAPAVEKACFWPDTVRESPDWSWSSPQHYVNIPRYSDRYDRQRDCPDGLCVTEAILKYAAELDRPGLNSEYRWQAFAWLCHLVGDLHQPLHAGFQDDRGGNRVDIEYRGEGTDLHHFWDSMLAEERLSGPGHAMAAVVRLPGAATSGAWNPGDVVSWTEESHALAATRAYPPTAVIDDAFADASWALIQQQWQLAAERLARILNTVLVKDRDRQD